MTDPHAPANDTANDAAVPGTPPRPKPKSTALTVQRTAKAMESNPLPILVGGLAIGALVGAMLPGTEREGKLLGPLGKRLTDTASGAAQAARDAGKSELDALGLNRDAARNQAGKLLEGVLKAMSTAGAAAVTAAKNKS